MRAPLIALGALALLAIPARAHAAFDPVGPGTTKLTLDKGFAAFLAQNGIELLPSAGAKRKGATFTLAVTGGQADPTEGRGEIANAGTLSFQSQRGRVPLRRITVKSTHQPLIAKVGGGQLKIATSHKTAAKRAGFGTSFSAKALRLSAKAATRLNKKLRPKGKPFWAGQPLGTLRTDAQPRLVTIEEEGRATIAFDPAFLAKLQSRFVSLNPIFPAEHQGPSFTFPIAAGGQLAPDGSEGTLRTGGSLEFLQLGAGQIFWQELWLDLAARTDSAEVDIEPTPAFPGKLGRIGVMDLGQAALSSNPKARAISLQAGQLTLSAQSAAAFNAAFAQGEPPVFAAGEAVGAVGFVGVGQ